MQGLGSDVRSALRQIRGAPGLALSVIACIAIGIGASTAVFGVARAMLMRPPDVRAPERLVRLFVHYDSGLRFGSLSWPDLRDLRERSRSFTDIVGEAPRPFHLSAGGRNERVLGSLVSGSYFEMLGVEMRLGRSFLPEEDRTPGSHPVAVLSHGFWQRRFAADPGILNGQILLNGHAFTVVGIAREGFLGTNVGIAPDVWVPLMMEPVAIPGQKALEARGFRWISFVTARLAPGVEIPEAERELEALVAGLAEEHPRSYKALRIDVYPEAAAGLHPQIRGAFVGVTALLSTVVGLVLLLACANVAGLLLARHAARRREIAVRLAMGAGRTRLVRQLLIESGLLALAAGAAGLLFASWLVRALERAPADLPLPVHVDLGLDPSALAFAALATGLTALLVGLAPALQSTRTDLVTALKEGAPGSGGGPSRSRRLLVAGQVAVSLTLLVGAALAVQSLRHTRQLSPGFEPDGQVVASFDVDLQGYDEDRGRQFLATLEEKVAGLPGVTAAGYAQDLPLSFASRQRRIVPEGWVTPAGQDDPLVDTTLAGPGYFEAMGMTLLRGRGFLPTDAPGAPPVLVVNRAFARRFWGEDDPIGKRVEVGSAHEVVGVVADAAWGSLGEEPRPFFYLPLAQNHTGAVNLHVRSSASPEDLAPAIRREVEALDGRLPLELRTMHQAMGFALLPARLIAGTVSGLATLALLLAAVGLYGLMAYNMRLGARDIAVRMAVGASPTDVLAHVVGRGMRLVAAGALPGLLGAALLARLMSGVIYGVAGAIPAAWNTASLTLAAVALAATLVPAWRATRVDPIAAIRAD